MRIYLVGGAVRNQLLGLPVSDRDWVVVGATPYDLIKLGFQQVGRNFPVFLHPKTHEEYALARTERKTGVGHSGFTCYTAPNITIKEDLLRRDITINAIAKNENGKLIDPFKGEQDIKKRLIRHISSSFTEDPLRILRVARLSAQLSSKNFTLANETRFLMKRMIDNNELNQISAERVWGETKKALQSSSPEIYFYTLRDCGALAILFPEIDQLFESSSSVRLPSKINAGIHALLTLKIAASLTDNIETRFATLCYWLGKILTPSKLSFYHTKNTIESISLIDSMCDRLRIPNKIKRLANLVSCLYAKIHRINQLHPKKIIDMFNQLDGWRNPEKINQVILACESIFRGHLKQLNNSYPQSKFVIEAFKTVQDVSILNLIKEGIKGEELKDKLTAQRIQALNNWKQRQKILPI